MGARVQPAPIMAFRRVGEERVNGTPLQVPANLQPSTLPQIFTIAATTAFANSWGDVQVNNGVSRREAAELGAFGINTLVYGFTNQRHDGLRHGRQRRGARLHT